MREKRKERKNRTMEKPEFGALFRKRLIIGLGIAVVICAVTLWIASAAYKTYCRYYGRERITDIHSELMNLFNENLEGIYRESEGTKYPTKRFLEQTEKAKEFFNSITRIGKAKYYPESADRVYDREFSSDGCKVFFRILGAENGYWGTFGYIGEETYFSDVKRIDLDGYCTEYPDIRIDRAFSHNDFVAYWHENFTDRGDFFILNRPLFIEDDNLSTENRYSAIYVVPCSLYLAYPIETIVYILFVLLTAVIVSFIFSRHSFSEKMKQYDLYTSRREIIRSIAHDLKTPLTSLAGYAELLQEENIEPEKRKHYIEMVPQNVSQMNSIITEILELSKNDSDEMTFAAERMDVEDICKEIVERTTGAFEKADLSVELSVEESFEISANRRVFEQALTNLIQNAAVHSKKKTIVHVKLKKVNMLGFGEIIIENTPDQMPTKPVEELVKPFVKGNDERGENKGSGVGLSVAKEGLELLGYRLEIEIKQDTFLARCIMGIADEQKPEAIDTLKNNSNNDVEKRSHQEENNSPFENKVDRIKKKAREIEICLKTLFLSEIIVVLMCLTSMSVGYTFDPRDLTGYFFVMSVLTVGLCLIKALLLFYMADHSKYYAVAGLLIGIAVLFYLLLDDDYYYKTLITGIFAFIVALFFQRAVTDSLGWVNTALEDQCRKYKIICITEMVAWLLLLYNASSGPSLMIIIVPHALLLILGIISLGLIRKSIKSITYFDAAGVKDYVRIKQP